MILLAALILIAGGPERTWTPEATLAALRRAHALSGRPVAEARHVCDVRLRGAAYPVIAVTDRYGAVEPRLYRRVELLDPSGRRARTLAYYLPAEPSRCQGDTLVFEGGDVTVDGADGRVVRFSGHGRRAVLAAPE